MKKMIYLSPPNFDLSFFNNRENAHSNNREIFQHIFNFEKELELLLEYTGEITALNSGTSAIHLALKLADVKKGDHVICQSFTFVASANPILYEGAIPIFVDSEAETWNLCPDLLENCFIDLKKQGICPKAVIVVHLYGNPAKIKEINDVCLKYGAFLIEDAAEALGSKIGGEYCGTFGDFGIFSFNYNKIISAAGGGALLCKKSLKEKALFLASQAKENSVGYEHRVVGYNYRMNHLQALLGKNQLPHLNKEVNKRKKINAYYRRCFESINGVDVFECTTYNSHPNFWLTTILIDSKLVNGVTNNSFRKALARENIESRLLWKPMHLQPLFKNALYYGNGVSGQLFARGLCLPSGSNFSDEDFNRIEKVIFDVFK